MATARQRAAARTNGHFGGAPNKRLVELRRKSRDKAMRIVASQQEESVRFLVYVRDNPNAPLNERVRCALELLNRGEMPAKSASYVGVGGLDELDNALAAPKLVVLGKYGADREQSSATVVDTSEGNGDGAGEARGELGAGSNGAHVHAPDA